MKETRNKKKWFDKENKKRKTNKRRIKKIRRYV